jgi:UDP-N-acetylmuramyl pentapeptide synthase
MLNNQTRLWIYNQYWQSASRRFWGIEGVLKGKTELFKYLTLHKKLAFINSEDSKLLKASKEIETYSFSTKEDSDVLIHFIDTNPNVVVSYKDLTIKSNLIGNYNFPNIAASIAIGNYFEIAPTKIKDAIEEYIPSNNRSQIIKQDNYTIILDAYNANPSSMEAAIKNFEQLKDYSYKVAFLGDMFELGEEAALEHQKISIFITNTNIDEIHLVGNNFYDTQNEDPRIKKHKSFDSLEKSWPLISRKEGSTLLIKGSRGMQLERVLDLL